jgi:Gpi18-like mannosyltransferase
VLVPFVLPSMHERYFYLADVLTLILAFYLPRQLWFVPIIVALVLLVRSAVWDFRRHRDKAALAP